MLGTRELTNHLSNLSDDETRVELSDYAVNTIRDHARRLGWTRSETSRMLLEEFARISSDDLDLIGYLRCRRPGSDFGLSRNVRAAVFAHRATRMAR